MSRGIQNPRWKDTYMSDQHSQQGHQPPGHNAGIYSITKLDLGMFLEGKVGLKARS